MMYYLYICALNAVFPVRVTMKVRAAAISYIHTVRSRWATDCGATAIPVLVSHYKKWLQLVPHSEILNLKDLCWGAAMTAEKTSWIRCIPKWLTANVKNENQPNSWKTNRLLPFHTAKQNRTYSTGAWPSLIFFFLGNCAVWDSSVGTVRINPWPGTLTTQPTSLCYCPSPRPPISVFTLVKK